jgi:peptidyl-prolyl cis-trans isomerase B (cyclophilin B)
MRMKSLRMLLVVLTVVLLASVFALQGCSTAADRSIEVSYGTADETDEPTEEPAEEPTIPFEEDAVHTPSYEIQGNEIAVITTNRGVIKFEFFGEDAPNHVAAFIELAQKGFYDGTKFHRVVREPEPFVIQGGDPLSKTDDPMVGTGGPGYSLAAEFNDHKHLEGTVSMARSQDPDSAGSQFYICLAPQPFLDGQYTVFGQVTEGLDIVQAIMQGDVMESVTIETE